MGLLKGQDSMSDYGTGQSFDKHEFMKAAKDAEAKRRAGTHVHSSKHGIIPVEQARALCNSGNAVPEDFKGNPDKEGQPVDWTKAK
jgi:hypothetical protein